MRDRDEYEDWMQDEGPPETFEEKLYRVDTFLKQKNMYTWWNHHFYVDDFMMFEDRVTLADHVYKHQNPPEYFDFLIAQLKEQRENIITWLLEQELYERCTPVNTKADQLLTELDVLKSKVKLLL